jgi:hypothetical protein
MHLLDLPAELRNRIYEYALTDSTSAGLEYKELSGDSDTQKSCYVITLNKKPFNILKNACRQLRAETTGLELAYNVLIFAQKHITAPQPTRLFDRFLDHASDADSAKLTAITLKGAYRAEREPFSSLVRLASWARRHPKVWVKYIPGDFCLGPPDIEGFPRDCEEWSIQEFNMASRAARLFLHAGVFWSVRMRGRSSFSEGVVAVTSQTTVLGLALFVHESEWGGCELRDVQAPNLRFWPFDVGDEKLRTGALWALVEGERVGGQVRKEWAAAMERWIAEGI